MRFCHVSALRPWLPVTMLIGAGLPMLASPAEAAPVRASRLDSTAIVEGRVLTNNGQPIDGAFVQSSSGVDSAITDRQGRFRLTRAVTSPSVLVVSAVGYQTQEVPVGAASAIHLAALPSYEPAIVPPPPPFEVGPAHVFDTQISGAYRVRYQSLTASGHGVQGWANNEYAIDGRYRTGDLLLGIDGYRLKTPLSINGDTPQPSTTPTVEQDAWSLWAGYDLAAAGFEFMPQLIFENGYFVPSNGGTPWTGTPMDYSQTRTSGALALAIGKRVGPLVASIRGETTFAEHTSLTGAPYGPTDVHMSKVGVDLGYNLMPGLRADLTFDRNFGGGTQLDEYADVVGLGLTYFPAQVQP